MSKTKSTSRQEIEIELAGLVDDFSNAKAAGDSEKASRAAWQIVLRVQGRLTRYLYVICGASLGDRLEDVFHDFILHFLLKVMPQHHPGRRLLPFLFKCAKNFVLDQIRKTNRERGRMLAFAEDDGPDSYASSIPANFSEMKTEVDRLLELLPDPRDREILVLRYGEEYSLRETAEIVSMSASSVGRHEKAARKKLRAFANNDLKDVVVLPLNGVHPAENNPAVQGSTR